jgi:serine phosphatase RsbU (regulator of sigma subunit)
MILYTDGLVEADKSIDIGLDRLAEVAAHAAAAELDGLVMTIVERLVEEARRRDDIAILAVRLQPSPVG